MKLIGIPIDHPTENTPTVLYIDPDRIIAIAPVAETADGSSIVMSAVDGARDTLVIRVNGSPAEVFRKIVDAIAIKSGDIWRKRR